VFWAHLGSKFEKETLEVEIFYVIQIRRIYADFKTLKNYKNVYIKTSVIKK
jgi:hypothetical protein